MLLDGDATPGAVPDAAIAVDGDAVGGGITLPRRVSGGVVFGCAGEFEEFGRIRETVVAVESSGASAEASGGRTDALRSGAPGGGPSGVAKRDPLRLGPSGGGTRGRAEDLRLPAGGGPGGGRTSASNPTGDAIVKTATNKHKQNIYPTTPTGKKKTTTNTRTTTKQL